MVQTPSPRTFDPVRPAVSFPKLEAETLAFWTANQIFEKSLREDQPDAPFYSFYDGPPFATGLPHYGHLLAGTLKDIVPRYFTMKGYRVPRRFGWDCHGLPVEYEINKAHKIESNKQVFAMGVKEYNSLCRGIVTRYSEEWKRTVHRLGRFVDMDNPYFTMNVEFMESVWWVFRQLWDKGLIYEGYKVVPYSTGISTPLSNFEAGENYKMVQDPAITVSFPIDGRNHEHFLAWTTTPWTLPSNLALAVSPKLEYVRVREKSADAGAPIYILAASRISAYWKDPATEVEILEIVMGSTLEGLKYSPLFTYFADHKADGAFRVLLSDHVTDDAGTGIVHMAPAYGEDDFQVCKKAGIALVNPVDDDGMFTADVSDFNGQRVKDADKGIIHMLKGMDRLYKNDTLTHSYPFCPRSETPLIYRAVSSWFVAVERLKGDLLETVKETNWVPDHLRDGRFGNWLENARDWSISRNRFWGTPLPIWKNAEGEMICIGSKEELEKLTGVTVNDLHMDTIDDLEIPSQKGGSPLRRITPVLDCWFESGSMPFAQYGYPKQNPDAIAKYFPADFIAEGLDQTRGWFYTLLVISTAILKRAPYRNVVVNGLVLAEDGKKMSKRLKNYPDPNLIFDEYGADALRLYMIDSPVVKAQELRFSEAGVRDVVRKILLRWWNAYSFFINYAGVDKFWPEGDGLQMPESPNILDRWILSRFASLVERTEREMATYRLYNVVPQLLSFVEELTNTYIRFNRPHFWADGMPPEKKAAYETLYFILLNLSRVMAPFAPFLSETIYQNLKKALPDHTSKESVHLENFPVADARMIDLSLESAVKVLDVIAMLGRNYREKIGVKGKIPLLKMTIIHRDSKLLDSLKPLEAYLREELNIREIIYDLDEDTYVQVQAKPNFPVLGKRLGPKMKEYAAKLQKLPLSEILTLEKGGSVTVDGEDFTLSDIEIRRAPKGTNENLMTHLEITLLVDPTVTAEQREEGLSREVLRKIQQARKNADLKLDQRIALKVRLPANLAAVTRRFAATIKAECLAQSIEYIAYDGVISATHTEEVELDDGMIGIGIDLK